MKPNIKLWQDKLQECEQKAEKLRAIIKNIQDTCNHTYPDGTTALSTYVGYHYKYDECQICGKKIDMR